MLLRNHSKASARTRNRVSARRRDAPEAPSESRPDVSEAHFGAQPGEPSRGFCGHPRIAEVDAPCRGSSARRERRWRGPGGSRHARCGGSARGTRPRARRSPGDAPGGSAGTSEGSVRRHWTAGPRSAHVTVRSDVSPCQVPVSASCQGRRHASVSSAATNARWCVVATTCPPLSSSRAQRQHRLGPVERHGRADVGRERGAAASLEESHQPIPALIAASSRWSVCSWMPSSVVRSGAGVSAWSRRRISLIESAICRVRAMVRTRSKSSST